MLISLHLFLLTTYRGGSSKSGETPQCYHVMTSTDILFWFEQVHLDVIASPFVLTSHLIQVAIIFLTKLCSSTLPARIRQRLLI